MSNYLHRNMQDYRSFVEGLAQEKSDTTFFNSGPNHAAIVMSNIFLYSKSIIRIFSGGFSGAVSNDRVYLQSLEDFLKQGGRLEVIVEKDLSSSGSSKIFRVFKKYSTQIKIFLTPSKVVSSETKIPLHFTVGDDAITRIETNTEDYTAQVNFGNEGYAKTFITIFNELINVSAPISLDNVA